MVGQNNHRCSARDHGSFQPIVTTVSGAESSYAIDLASSYHVQKFTVLDGSMLYNNTWRNQECQM